MQRATHHHLLTMARPGKVLSFGSEARSRCAAHLIPATEPPDQDTTFPPPPRRSTRPSPVPQLPAPQVPAFHFHLSPLPVFTTSGFLLPTQQNPRAPTSTSPRHTTRPSVNRQHSHPPDPSSFCIASRHHRRNAPPLPFSSLTYRTR